MSHTALILFAPVFTLERFNDPTWARPGRTMYERGGLRFFPGRDTAPLLVDHEDGNEIGTVHKLATIDWTDGPWIYASATVDDPPLWLKRGTPVSFGFGPVHTRNVHIRDGRAEVVAKALVNEVSVLSPAEQPAEPCAKVLSLDETSSSLAVDTTSNRAAAGEVIPGDGRTITRYFGNAVLAVGGKPLLRRSTGETIRREGRDYVIDQPDGSQVIYSAEGYREALHDGTLVVR